MTHDFTPVSLVIPENLQIIRLLSDQIAELHLLSSGVRFLGVVEILSNYRIIYVIEDAYSTELLEAFFCRILERVCLLLQPCQIFGHSQVSAVDECLQVGVRVLFKEFCANFHQIGLDRRERLVDSLGLDLEDLVDAEVSVGNVERFQVEIFLVVHLEAHVDHLLLLFELGCINFAFL